MEGAIFLEDRARIAPLGGTAFQAVQAQVGNLCHQATLAGLTGVSGRHVPAKMRFRMFGAVGRTWIDDARAGRLPPYFRYGDNVRTVPLIRGARALCGAATGLRTG